MIDGSKDNIATITSANNSGLTINKSNLSTGTHSITATKTADATSTLNTTSLGFSLTNNDGDPVNLAEGVHNIDVIQASDVAKKTSGAVSISDAFGNDLTLAATATVGTISTGNVGTADATNVGTYSFSLQYWDVNEGTTAAHNISVNVEVGDTAVTVAQKIHNAINQISELAGKVTASATAAGPINIHTVNEGAQFAIKTSNFQTTGPTADLFTIASTDARGVSDNQLDVTITTANGAAINNTITLTAQSYSSLSALVTELDTQLDTAFGKEAGGSTQSDIDAVIVDSNKIQLRLADEGSDYSIKMGTLGSASGYLEHYLGLTEDTIANTGTDAKISFDGYINTISSIQYGATSTVTLANKAAGESGRGTINMTIANALQGVNVGSALLDVTAAKFDVRLDGGPATAVSAGVDATVFNADRSESVNVRYALDSLGGTETINNVDRSLVFQIGANVGQTSRIGLRSMSATSLGKNLVGNMFTSLANIDVTTVQGAQDAQAVIDAAINEVSTTRGTLGSFQKNTLDSNLRNLRIAAQNLTASESQIRDTDMAAEMSEFTKNQILVQAGTSMLAQANQVPQIILSLFR